MSVNKRLIRAVSAMKGKLARPRPLVVDGIAHVGLKVSDLGRSRKFYREVLGLDSYPTNPGVAYVPIGKDRLVLYEPHTGGSNFHFGFRVDNASKVDEWCKWLKSKNVKIQEDITERHKYRSIKVRDPDGHWIEISQEN